MNDDSCCNQTPCFVMHVYATYLTHRTHHPWTHHVQRLHHPVPSTSRSPIPYRHLHLQFDVPAFLVKCSVSNSCCTLLTLRFNRLLQWLGVFSPSLSCVCNRWTSLICFNERPCSESPSSILPLQYPRPYTCTINDWDVTVFCVGGRASLRVGWKTCQSRLSHQPLL